MSQQVHARRHAQRGCERGQGGAFGPFAREHDVDVEPARGDRAQQQPIVLHGHQSADAADDERPVRHAPLATQRVARARMRRRGLGHGEAAEVDAVVQHLNRGLGQADVIDQIGLELPRDGEDGVGVAAHPALHGKARRAVVELAAVLAVHQRLRARQLGAREAVEERFGVAGVHDVRPRAAQQPGQAQGQAWVVAAAPVELVDRHARVVDAARELAGALEAAHRRLEARAVEPVDDVDDPVLEPAGLQADQHMENPDRRPDRAHAASAAGRASTSNTRSTRSQRKSASRRTRRPSVRCRLT